MKKKYTVQEWLPLKSVLENGIIKLKNNTYLKIIKINPINYNLKSELEKQAILNSYKLFLKTCNFDIQILIQSSKQDLSKHISKIQLENKKDENKNLKKIYFEYIKHIQNINQNTKTSSKNFFILIKYNSPKKEKIDINLEKIIINNLNEKYFKIKECLSRCGNTVIDLENKEETIKILYSFFNNRNFINDFIK